MTVIEDENENFENRKNWLAKFFEIAILWENVIQGDVSWGENKNF